MILLERIIPYSRQIRGMQDSLQAYYTARSEVEVGRFLFSESSDTSGVRRNMDTGEWRIGANEPIALGMPNISNSKTGESIVIAQDRTIPMNILLYDNDTNPVGFGTSKGKPSYHLLSSFWWGLTFDLSGINTGSGFGLNLAIDPDMPGPQTIGVEFIYSKESDNPFFGTINITGNGNIFDAKNADNETLSYFLAGQNCQVAHCFMKLQLKTPSQPSVNINLSVPSSSINTIPDLNAILIADGLSDNGQYHARIVELIPVTQSI